MSCGAVGQASSFSRPMPDGRLEMTDRISTPEDASIRAAKATSDRLEACPWSLDIMSRQFPSPGGRIENSPAVHCRVQFRHLIRPGGTDEFIPCHASVPIPMDVSVIQPSLRDSMPLFDNPTLERVGYSQISLRETAGG